MSRITSKQSLKARSLLKWSHKDVVSKCSNLQLYKLKAFEQNKGTLTIIENRILRDVYEDHNIIFKGMLEARLQDKDENIQTAKLDQSAYYDVEDEGEYALKEQTAGDTNKKDRKDEPDY